jgi:hypothetical protein
MGAIPSSWRFRPNPRLHNVITEKDKPKLIAILLTMASSSIPSPASRVTQTNNKDSIDDVVTINEKVNLTKPQHQVLKTICDTYEISLQNTCSKH